MASTQEAERWLALEFVTVAVVRTIHGFRDQHGLLGPSEFAAMLAAYAMLSVLVLYQPTAQLAAMLGVLVVLAVLLRPTSVGDKVSNLGADAARSVGDFARSKATSSPAIAKGVA